MSGGRGQAGLAARPLVVVTPWTTTLTPLHGLEDAVLQVAARPLPIGVGTPKKSMILQQFFQKKKRGLVGSPCEAKAILLGPKKGKAVIA